MSDKLDDLHEFDGYHLKVTSFFLNDLFKSCRKFSSKGYLCWCQRNLL